MLLIIGAIFVALLLAAWATTPQTMRVEDSTLQVTRALPSSITAVTSPGIDIGLSGPNAFVAAEKWEFDLVIPTVSTGELPDTKTFTYAMNSSPNADLSSPTVHGTIYTQTGAGGAGAAGKEVRWRPPSNCNRYVFFTITPSASGTGDASAETATLKAVF